MPPVPHIPFAVPGRQLPFGPQQPVGHDTASHTQVPFTQCLPLPQSAPVPQRQAPLGAQVSALMGLQATQVPPALPHAASDGVTHAPSAQQPLGQLCELHTQVPPMHVLPAVHGPAPAPQRHAPVATSQVSAIALSHAMHAVPPMPQLASVGE
jgi:hypothetical protein